MKTLLEWFVGGIMLGVIIYTFAEFLDTYL